MEFLAQERFVLRCHILETETSDVLARRHRIWLQWMVDDRTERIVDTDALLQGNNLVPMLHGLFLTIAYQRVSSLRCEAGSRELAGIHIHVEVGDGDVLCHFV